MERSYELLDLGELECGRSLPDNHYSAFVFHNGYEGRIQEFIRSGGERQASIASRSYVGKPHRFQFSS